MNHTIKQNTQGTHIVLLTFSISTLFFVLFCSAFSHAQNLPSLLTEKNINATFSILAYDEKAQEWGIAVATNNIYVGNSTIYIQPGLGAFSVIAETEPKYAIEGFKKLRQGKTIKEAVLEVRDRDEASNYRQISGIDANGSVFAFTGNSLKYWHGHAAQILGDGYVVMGNQLADNVLSEMSQTFEKSSGTLAQRLLKSLLAGQKKGGQVSGKQSAAIVVKGTENSWYNQIDLRVDNSKKPLQELQILMNYHYGRIKLNQALFAQRKDRIEDAKEKLKTAETMLEGWTGIYPKIIHANLSLNNQSAAIDWIQKGLKENPNWPVYLPAFYLLRDHPSLKGLIDPETFSVKDWESAIIMLSKLGRESEAIELGLNLIEKKVESSYLIFLIGRSYFQQKQYTKASEFLQKSVDMDADNFEAKQLLNNVKKR